MKWIKRILIFILLIVVIGLISGGLYLRSLKPTYDGNAALAGLSTTVEVTYDMTGIPHIAADNNADAFRALGYVHAQDRLFQMEMLRRVGSGTLAEILGKDVIDVDRFFRTAGIRQHCEENAKRFMNSKDSAFQQLAFAYLEGINTFIKNGPDPIEYKLAGVPKKEFDEKDLYYIIGYITYSFDAALRTDPLADKINRKLGTDYFNDLNTNFRPTQTVIPSMSDTDSIVFSQLSTLTSNVFNKLPLPQFNASNAWVVSGNKTKSGKVLFSNDAHIGYAQPSVWFEAHLKTPDLNLYGNFLAGFPYPLIGHTNHHSWGLTMFLNDDLDLYRETIKEDSVLYKGKWTALEKRMEVIPVKGAENDTIEIITTPHGPIMNNVSKLLQETPPVAMSWTFIDTPMEALQVAYGFSFSKSMEEFYNAASRLSAPGLNVMYGDVDNNIGWWATAQLKIRPEHVHSKVILDGASGNDDILGYYTYEQNPHDINPERGYVYSANNQSLMPDSSLYPGYYYAGARGYAISRALEQKDDWDIDANKALITSSTSPVFPGNVNLLTKYIAPETELEKSALDIVQSWSGAHDTDNIAPTIYYKWIYYVLQEGMEDDLGETDFQNFLSTMMYLRSVPTLLQNDSSIWWDIQSTEQRETLADISQIAWKKAITKLTGDWGDNIHQWTWGKVHVVEHVHPFTQSAPFLSDFLNVGTYPLSGGEEVIDKESFRLSDDKIIYTKAGPSMRIIIDFADLENSVSVIPTGQSGNPFSPFYRNQAQLFVNHQFRSQMMHADTIAAHAFGKLVLKPE
tara:strand:- start:3349 stop:5730 length:2382 start_codon:yes stop_codon:yes gene_type:complete